MVAKLTQGDLYRGIKKGMAGGSSSSRASAMDKLGIKKQGQGLRKGKKVGIMKTKKGANKYMRRAGLSLKERKRVMKTMFGQESAGRTAASGSDQATGGAPKKRTGVFGFGGGSESQKADHLRSQVGRRPGSPGYTSDRSDSSRPPKLVT